MMNRAEQNWPEDHSITIPESSATPLHETLRPFTKLQALRIWIEGDTYVAEVRMTKSVFEPLHLEF